jgi:hypothetical protein
MQCIERAMYGWMCNAMHTALGGRAGHWPQRLRFRVSAGVVQRKHSTAGVVWWALLPRPACRITGWMACCTAWSRHWHVQSAGIVDAVNVGCVRAFVTQLGHSLHVQHCQVCSSSLCCFFGFKRACSQLCGVHLLLFWMFNNMLELI